MKFIFLLSTLTFASTQILLFTILPLLSEKLSFPLSYIIGCFSLGSFLFLWGAPFWAEKSQTLGRNQVLSFGLLGLAFSFALILLLLNLPYKMSFLSILGILLFSRILYGTLASAIVPVAQLGHADLAPRDEHMSSMFSHSLSLNLGRAVGPLLLLAFKDHLSYLLIAVTLWTLGLLLINHFISSETFVAPVSSEVDSPWPSIARLLWLPLAVTILYTTYTGMLHSSLGDTLQTTFTLTGLAASTLMAKVILVGSLVMAGTQALGKVFLKNHVRPTLVLGLVSLTIGALLFSIISTSTQLWSGIVFVSLGLALIHPSHLTLVHLNSPKEVIGRNVGLLASGNTIGYALGGALASIFLDFDVNKIALAIVSLLFVMAIINCRKVTYA